MPCGYIPTTSLVAITADWLETKVSSRFGPGLQVLARTPTMKAMKTRVRPTFSYSVFYEQAPEGGFVAFVPTLPGCHTQGQTLEEAECNIKEAIALYLESQAAHGEPLPEEGRSFQGRVTVPLSVP